MGGGGGTVSTAGIWRREDIELLLKLYLVEGFTRESIAKSLGRSKSAVGRRISKLGLCKLDRGNILKYNSLMGQDLTEEEAPLLRPVRVQLPIRESPAKIPRAEKVSFHWSDAHFPFQDDRVIDIAYQIVSEIKPDILVCHGDMTDFWQISDHRPPLETKLTTDQVDIQETIEMAARHLSYMNYLAKPERMIYLQGNHEDRFDRLLSKIQQDVKLSSLLRIPKIQEVLNLDYLLGLGDIDCETYTYLEGDRLVLFDRLLLLHGYKSTIWATRATLHNYGVSSMFGHSHRIQNYTKSDLNGTNSSWNIGCTCDLSPHWRQRPDWHQGFAVVTWHETDTGWMFNVEQIRVHDGVGLFRGSLYRA